MTSQGTAHGRFQRAIHRRNVREAETAAREMGRLSWLTGTGASAARWYWEVGAADQAPPPVSVPVGFTTFPGEVWAAPRSWVERSCPTLTYFNEVDRRG